jgi:hypothetical protein
VKLGVLHDAETVVLVRFVPAITKIAVLAERYDREGASKGMGRIDLPYARSEWPVLLAQVAAALFEAPRRVDPAQIARPAIGLALQPAPAVVLATDRGVPYGAYASLGGGAAAVAGGIALLLSARSSVQALDEKTACSSGYCLIRGITYEEAHGEASSIRTRQGIAYASIGIGADWRSSARGCCSTANDDQGRCCR